MPKIQIILDESLLAAVDDDAKERTSNRSAGYKANSTRFRKTAQRFRVDFPARLTVQQMASDAGEVS